MASKIVTLAAILASIVVALVPVAEARKWSLPQNGDRPYLRKLSRDDSNGIVHAGNGAFVDGTETVYDDFSLAWRFLGFYKDCNVCLDDDGGDEEEFRDPSECIEDGEDTTVCRRYALWAAYVDEGYTGNGNNEYQFYDRKHKRWDDSSCSNTNNNNNNGGENRCVRMDCHDPFSKNFKLIGVYKDHKIDAFLENMIDYSGDCVWNDDEYKFMQAMNSNSDNNNNIDDWPPKKCTAFSNGYYDATPTSGGNLEMTLFSDASCTQLYEGNDKSEEDMESLVGRSSGDLASWNAAMDAFKICQPCVSYDTHFLGSGSSSSSGGRNKKNGYNSNGDRYGGQNNQQQGDDDGKQEDEYFVCQNNLQQDDPINQCEVFVEGGQDTMKVATYRDILLAESQGSVTGIDLSPSSERRRGRFVMGKPFVEANHKWLSILLLFLSIAYFCVSLSKLFEKDRSKNSNHKTMNEPLVAGKSDQERKNKGSKSSKSVATTVAVANNGRKNKEQKATEREQKRAQKKEQQKQKKKSILKKSKYNDDEDGWSQESTHYSKFQI